MDVTGASGAIPRRDLQRQEAHASLYYDEIRKRTGDIEAIAKNTGLTVDDVEKIKKHIFFNKYDLGENELTRFDPSYDMAVSWQRLIEGKEIREMDIIMLKHELMEYGLMNEQGLDYKTAHDISESQYNYTECTKKLDREEGLS